VRRLARRPAFALVATATLAVAIGGATATFSVADAVILRPLPYAQPERLVSSVSVRRKAAPEVATV